MNTLHEWPDIAWSVEGPNIAIDGWAYAKELRQIADWLDARNGVKPDEGAAPMEAPIHVWWFDDAPEHLRNLSTSGGDEDWLAEVAPEVAETARFWMYPGSAFGYCDVDEFPHPTRPGWVVRIGSHA